MPRLAVSLELEPADRVIDWDVRCLVCKGGSCEWKFRFLGHGEQRGIHTRCKIEIERQGLPESTEEARSA